MNNKKINRSTKKCLFLTTLSTLVFAITLLVGLPYLSHAATYAYVNNFGTLSHVSADSPTEAISRAVNIAPHSGVMLVSSITIPVQIQQTNTNQVQGQVSQYAYVNNFGTLSYVSANSPTEALSKAVNRALHSGVMLVN